MVVMRGADEPLKVVAGEHDPDHLRRDAPDLADLQNPRAEFVADAACGPFGRN
jgi:hypothetical protein